MREWKGTAVTENLPEVLDFVEQCLGERDCPAKTLMQIQVAVEEIFANIARYAYHPGPGMVSVRIEILERPAAAKITFTDRGVIYDPLARDEPDVTLAAEDREIGGLGIYLVKKTMDDVSYEYREGQNILMVRKDFG